MELSRRDLLKSGLGALSVYGFSLFKSPNGERVCEAAGLERIADIPLIWMATGSCSGCSVSLLNAGSPTVQSLILREVVPNLKLWLGFHATIMASAGELAMDSLEALVDEHEGGYVLVVDGATATKEDGLYCAVGERDEKPITGMEHILALSRTAKAVLAVGACSSFGGIPAADPNPTGAKSVTELLNEADIKVPVVNIPGCPPHPDWIVGSIATLMLGGLEGLQLDEQSRPGPYFSELLHNNCPYRGHFIRGQFAQHYGEHGCLVRLGCKGPITHADCSIRHWNNGTNWCVEAGHPCIGCTEPEFPYEKSMFAPVEASLLAIPGYYPPSVQEDGSQATKDTYTAVGLIGLAGFLAGAGVTAAAKDLNTEGASESSAPGRSGEE